VRAYVGVTDYEWFKSLAKWPGLDEINFWQPGGNREFSALKPGELFLFKLHSPRNFVVGGGFFAYSTLLPVSLAWEAFEKRNGVDSLSQMRARIENYRKAKPSGDDYRIGCILLSQPFFLGESSWVPIPRDWSGNIVQGKRYDLDSDPGREMWRRVQAGMVVQEPTIPIAAEVGPRYGEPILVEPRLGQGIFRVKITDVYERRCAVSGEKALPTLEAVHIRPYSNDGPHSVQNGLLMRSDIHRLFDRGYATVTPEFRFQASRRLKTEFDNGKEYLDMQGKEIWVPRVDSLRPSREYLEWHNRNVFRE